jgi:regulator of sigma E protease
VQERLDPLQAIRYGLTTNWRYVKATLVVLGHLLKGYGSAQATVSGPIGVAAATSRAAESGAVVLLLFTGFISLNLGLFNLLPIPGLDGGAIFILLMEQILQLLGWSISQGVRELIFRFGFAVLAGIACIAIILDLTRLF